MSGLSDHLEFRIEGVERELRRKTLAIRQTIFGRGSITASVQSIDGSYFPAEQEEVEITEITAGGSPAGTVIARALIDKVEIGGLEDVPEVPADSRIVAPDSRAMFERLWMTEVVAAGTLKQALQRIEVKLDGSGVTLDPAQVNGPDLPELQWDPKRLDSCADELSTLTGYIIEIDPENILRAYTPGTYSAPFDVIEGEKKTDGDLKVESSAEPRVNTVVIFGGDGTHDVVDERHDGDGTSRRFEIDAPVVVKTNGQFGEPILLSTWDGTTSPPTLIGGFLVGIVGIDDRPWLYDAATQELVQRIDQTLLAVGHYLTVNYPGQFPIRVEVNNLGSPPERTVEIVFREPLIFSKSALITQAQAELDRRQQANTRTVRFATFEQGLRPGMSLFVDVPMRNVPSATVLVTDILSRDVGADFLRREVTAIEGIPIGSWRDWYRNRFISGGTGSGVLTGVASPIGSTNPPASIGGGLSVMTGLGHPQGVIVADPGRLYVDSQTGWMYRKMAGTGNTGWYPIVDFIGAGVANLASGWAASSGANDATQTVFVQNVGGTNGVSGEAPKFQPDGVYRCIKTLASQFTLYGRNFDPGFGASWTRMSFQHDFDLVFRIVTDASAITALQYWMGVTDTDPTPSTDTASGSCIWMRYSTTASDPGWVGVTNNGGTQNVTGLVGAIAADTAYVLRIRKVGGTVYFSVNDGAEVASSTSVPTTGNAPFTAAYVAITTSSPGLSDERAFYFGRVGATIAAF